MQGLFLGISNGIVCLAYCAPVLVPYLMGESRGMSYNVSLVIRFLFGRLLGYLAFGLLSLAFGRLLLQLAGVRELTIGTAYVVLSLFLIAYGLFGVRPACPANVVGRIGHRMVHSPFLIPVVAGFTTGLSLCPPFLIALARGSQETTVAQNLLFFSAFFLGTSIFFAPFPFIGLVRSSSAFRFIGKMTTAMIGCYYLYSGITLVVGGIGAI
jgi:hypothetical protein